MAEAIAAALKAPVFDVTSSNPSVVEDFDVLILGTPVEGFRPAKPAADFVKRLPKADGKRAILFCTYKLWKGGVFKILERDLSSKGYRVILSVPKRGIKFDKPADFLDCVQKVQEALRK